MTSVLLLCILIWSLFLSLGSVTDARSAKSRTTSKKKSGKLGTRIYTVIVGVSFCVVVAFISFALPKQVKLRHTAVPYSDLVGSIRDGSVIRVQFVENSRVIYYNTKQSLEEGVGIPQSELGQMGLLIKAFEPKWKFYTRNVADDKYQLIKMLKDQGITYGSDPELLSDSMKTFAFAMLQLAPYWFMLGVQGFQLYHQLNLGKMTKRKPSKKQSVTFDDVEGVDSAKAELLEVICPLFWYQFVRIASNDLGNKYIILHMHLNVDCLVHK